MEQILGIDLHSRNGYYAIADLTGKKIFETRLPNDLQTILARLAPYKEQLTSVIVESTFNWYWLIDGLMDNGYPVELANPGGFSPYAGLKHSNDKTDAFFLTEMKRLGILPVGYIYPKEQRPIRDLLRRRLKLVQQKSSHILSFQSLMTRQTGHKPTVNAIKQIQEDDLENLLDEQHLVLAGQTNIAIIRFFEKKIAVLEKAVLEQIQLQPEFEKLLTVSGIGKVLALTIMLETGDIDRFATAGNYSSYCRLVKTRRTSDGKKKGEGNRKNGNKYLEWAYVEAANFMRRFCPEAKKYYLRKMSKTNKIVATKSLAAKISKACYFIIRDQVEFKVEKIFG